MEEMNFLNYRLSGWRQYGYNWCRECENQFLIGFIHSNENLKKYYYDCIMSVEDDRFIINSFNLINSFNNFKIKLMPLVIYGVEEIDKAKDELDAVIRKFNKLHLFT